MEVHWVLAVQGLRCRRVYKADSSRQRRSPLHLSYTSITTLFSFDPPTGTPRPTHIFTSSTTKMQLNNVLLVLSLALPFSNPVTALPAYLEVDTIPDFTREITSPLLDYNDVVLSLVNERSLRGDYTAQYEKRAVEWEYVGCTTDGPARALDYQVRIGQATPQKCQAVCEARGNVYSAIQCESPL